VLDEFVPGENNIDLRKGEDGSEGIGWRVKDQAFNGGTLEDRSVCFGGGAKVNIGKEEGGGVPKMEGGSRDSRAQIIEKKSRVGDEEVIDVKGDAIARAFGVFHSAQPTFCTVNPEFGEVPAQKIGVESKSHRFDTEGRAVLNAADFECSNTAPTS